MKKMMISVLAFAALGAASMATQTAGAGQWQGSPWYPAGTWTNFSTSGSCSGCAGGVFNADLVVSDPPISPTGVTLTANNTGKVNGNPTCHQAWALCADFSYIIAPFVCTNTVGGAQNESLTSQLSNSFAVGYYSGGTDTGYCPSAFPYYRGAVNIYQW
jgi:hypothetical protein